MPKLPCEAIVFYAEKRLITSREIDKLVQRREITPDCGMRARVALSRQIRMNGRRRK